ncbi:ABC-type branched-chain amino acid transport system, substrate-binding protein [Maridesulfovibrio ferrireducens]|uniref:ABC-type branched-chain amino acid transport system, substrate-binding protein n=1 Tax=Maridesulfovibrio ferrireducens TaxID=246191 RepID=A0A1G9ELS4_9BACT|nr:ABC transporter substrate-binding protein [Maridesulfovibrio ferrireducens]SDK77100.1 ABC-type branched-chain amino acid transport system, substrate-binding protein [Maridesulfovibrio ferrireducens]
MRILLLTIALLFSFYSTVSAQELILGTIFETKGENALTAQETMNGAILAVKKFNDSNQNFKIKLECESSTNEPLEIIRAVHKLTATKGITAATGIISENAALSAAPVFQAAQLPFLCTGAQLSGLTTPETPETFTLAVSDSKIGTDLAKYTFATLEAENIFLIRSDMNDSTAKQAESFSANFKTKGGTILSEMRITEPDPDLSYIMKAIEALAPLPQSDSKKTEDAMGVSNYIDEGAAIITQKRTPPPEIQEIEAVVIFASAKVSAKLLSLMKEKEMAYNIVGGTSFDMVAMKKPIASWSGNIIFASQASLTRENNLVKLFVKAYTELFGEQPQTGYAALGFDSILLLAHAAGTTGNPSVNIRTNLPAVNKFKGVSGEISFKNGSVEKPLYIIQSDAGQISLAAEMQ